MSNQKVIHLGKPTPHVAKQATVENALPAEMANHLFLFVSYPHGWEYDGARGFLPSLSEITAKPGVNGVGDDGRMARPQGSAIQKGGTIIDPADRRLGPWKNYVAEFPVVGDRKHFCFKSAGYTVLPQGRVIAEDHSADMREFRAHIRDSGIIPAMEPVVFEMLLEIERRGLQRLQKDVVAGRRLPEEVTAKRERLAAMQRAWDATAPTDTVEEPAAPQDGTEAAQPTAGKPVRLRSRPTTQADIETALTPAAPAEGG